MSPLLTLRGNTSYGAGTLDPCSADPLAGDDAALERLMQAELQRNLQATPVAGIFSLRTPPHLQGPGVHGHYKALTFRRSIAVERPADEVEFVHRFHPLAQAVFAEAWKVLTLPLSEGRLGERLAVRRHPAANKTGPYALFTFAATGQPPNGAFLAVAVAADGKVLGDEYAALAMDDSAPFGEVPWSSVEGAFNAGFAQLTRTAEQAAAARQAESAGRYKAARGREATMLREDAERYRMDRLQEIDREEEQARIPERVAEGLLPLVFEQRETYGFKALRAAVETFHARRMQDIAAFVEGERPPPLHPLGVLLVLPAERK
jgi:hypothetical protein